MRGFLLVTALIIIMNIFLKIFNSHILTEKAFDITYIRIKFQSPRPESFAIYKRTSEDGPWLPYQFYRLVHSMLDVAAINVSLDVTLLSLPPPYPHFQIKVNKLPFYV